MAPKSVALLLAKSLHDEGASRSEISRRLGAMPDLSKSRKSQILKTVCSKVISLFMQTCKKTSITQRYYVGGGSGESHRRSQLLRLY